MNAAQAKKISLYDLLASLGHHPDKTSSRHNDVWYRSPFRNEKTASFKINIKNNVWYDHGEGQGGNIIDFVMKYKNCGFNDALVFLSDNSIKPTLIARPVPVNDAEATLDIFNNKSPLIREIKPVYHYALKEYIKERGIIPSVAFKYLKEINYEVGGKNYFALGFKNNSDGWELRSSIFKGCIGNKDISIIESSSEKVSVFEGFMDYLSYLTLRNGEELKGDVIILNSTSMKGRAVELMKEKNYRVIDTYMDNDKGGLSVYDFIGKEFSAVEINSKNALYMPYKDFNDYLRAKQVKYIS